MTTLLDGEISAPAEPVRRSRRFRIIAALIVVLVLALIGTGIGALVYVNTYQPFGAAGAETSGPAPGSDRFVVRSSDGLHDTGFLITAPPLGTATIYYSFANDGSHATRLLGLARSQVVGISDLNWAPFTGALRDFRERRNFPMTLKPHSAILLMVTLEQPRCGTNGLPETLTGLPIRWSAFGVHHVWTLSLSGDDPTNLPITLCPPRAAIARRDRR